jgi:hypothetical protein
MEPKPLTLTAEEAQYIETRRLNREEVCAVYDVPPPVVHILDRATFSNITEQMRSMYRDTMAPRLGLYESALDSQLRPDFDPKGDLYAEFLLDEVLRGSFEQRAAAYEVMTRIGGMTPAEVREKENLPYKGEDTDQLYVNAATVPLGAIPKRVQALEENLTELPPGQSLPAVPQTAPAAQPAKCVECDTEAKTSARGLCRACEGKRGRRES